MAATDRNVLRLGAYELLHSDTPPRVVIDEAVELAKRFGAAQSSQFVNGILDKVMHTVKVNVECRNHNDEEMPNVEI
jgi:N utilization substance protein B